MALSANGGDDDDDALDLESCFSCAAAAASVVLEIDFPPNSVREGRLVQFPPLDTCAVEWHGRSKDRRLV